MNELTLKSAKFLEVISDPLIMDIITHRIAEGESLNDLTKAWGIGYGRMVRWLNEDAARADLFSKALEARAHSLVEEALKIADGADAENLGCSKLQVDTRLKIAGKWDRKRYGDGEDSSGVGKTNITIVIGRSNGVAGAGVADRVIDHVPDEETI